MAENEYLDSSKGLRWRSVVQAIRDGCSIDEIAERVEDCFFKTLRQIRRDLPLAEMIIAMDIPDELMPDELMLVCKSIDDGADVKESLMRAVLELSSTSEQLRRFLGDALGVCLYDLPYLAAISDDSISITQVRAVLAEVRSHLSDELQRVADKLAEKPDWAPCEADRGQPTLSQDERTRRILEESLLAGSGNGYTLMI